MLPSLKAMAAASILAAGLAWDTTTLPMDLRDYMKRKASMLDGAVTEWSSLSGEQVSTRQGHRDAIIACSVLGDRRLATCSWDKTVRVWSASGECKATLTGHDSGVWSVVGLGDSRIASGGSDHRVRVYDLAGPETDEDGEPAHRTLVGHTGAVVALCKLPDEQLASGSMDNTIRIWNLYSGTTMSVLYGHSGSVLAACALRQPPREVIHAGWRPELVGRRSSLRRRRRSTATSRPSGTAAVWTSAEAARQLRTLLVTGSADRTIRVWDTSAVECVAVLRGHHASVLAVIALEGGLVVSGSCDSTVRLWDPVSGRQRLVLRGHTGYVTCLAALPNDRVISGSTDRTLRIWDLLSGRLQQQLSQPDHLAAPRCLAVIPHTEPRSARRRAVAKCCPGQHGSASVCVCS